MAPLFVSFYCNNNLIRWDIDFFESNRYTRGIHTQTQYEIEEGGMDESGLNAVIGAFIVGGLSLVVFFVLGLAAVFGLWKLFTKAGKPGFYAIIPFLNLYTLVEITGLPVTWFWYSIIAGILATWTGGFFGLVNLFLTFIIFRQLMRVFGKSDSIGNVIINMIFAYITLPILGMSDAQYLGPQQSSDVPALPWIN